MPKFSRRGERVTDFERLLIAECDDSRSVFLDLARRLLDREASRAAVYRHIDAEITKRCQRCNLPLDLIGDALEAATDEAAIAAGGEA